MYQGQANFPVPESADQQEAHMAYNTILLCLSSIQSVPRLIDVAIELGTTFGSHIHAVYVLPGAIVYSGIEYGGTVQVYDEVRRYYEKHQEEVRTKFTAAMKKEGLTFDFQVIDSTTADTTEDYVRSARSADLVVVSPLGNVNFPGVEADFSERMVLGAGRPVLILPRGNDTKPIRGNVLLAWNDSREAARAAFDAIPFMSAAKKTHVATIGPQRGIVHGAILAETLDRHGAKVETLSLSLDGLTEGEVLLRAAKDHGARLLVTGCYGHSRLSEFIFGGVSRHIFNTLDMPILMSH
jgi:nucleotide-binding universal stress UspA family protein